MTNDKAPETTWYKLGPSFDVETNGTIWGLSDYSPTDEEDSHTMFAWFYNETKIDRVLADHNAAAVLAQLKEALEDFLDLQNGAPLVQYEKEYDAAYARCRDLLDLIDQWEAEA